MDNTSNKKQNNTSNEIDLLELFGSIYRSIKEFFNLLTLFIIRIIVFYFRNIIIIIASLIIAFGITYFIIPLNTKIYKTDLIAKTYVVNNRDVINSVNKILESNLINNEDNAITSITGHYLLDINRNGKWDIKESYSDILKNSNINTLDSNTIKKRVKSFFCIHLEVKDSTVIHKVKKELLNFLFENDRVNLLTKIRNEQNKAMLIVVDNEINRLDSLVEKEYFEPYNEFYTSKSNETFMLNEKETKLYHKDLFELMQKKQNIERSLILYKGPYYIVNDFTTPKASFVRNTLAIDIYYLLFILGTLIALAFDKKCIYIKKIKEFYYSRK